MRVTKNRDVKVDKNVLRELLTEKDLEKWKKVKRIHSKYFLDSRNTKLYGTGHCFAEFLSFRKTEKIQKKYFELFPESEKTISFCSFVYFPLNFVLSLWVSHLIFEFCTFHLIVYHFFELFTFLRNVYLSSSCIPF